MRIARVVKVVILIALALHLGRSFAKYAADPQVAGQKAMAAYLRAAPIAGPIGCFNAGVIGYYSGKRIVNLDGLVNDTGLLDYLRRGRVWDYVDDQKIDWVVDYDLAMDPAKWETVHAEAGGWRLYRRRPSAPGAPPGKPGGPEGP